jgi:hypothetical protein
MRSPGIMRKPRSAKARGGPTLWYAGASALALRLRSNAHAPFAPTAKADESRTVILKECRSRGGYML